MDSKNHKRQIGHVLLSTILSLVIVFVGVPLVSAIELESFHAKIGLLALVVCFYSTLYLR